MKLKLISILLLLSVSSFAQTISVNYSPVIPEVDQKYGRMIWFNNGTSMSCLGPQGLSVKSTSKLTELKSDYTFGNKSDFGLTDLKEENYGRIWNIKNKGAGYESIIAIKTGSSDNMILKKVILNEKGEVVNDDAEIGTYPLNAIGYLSQSTVSPDGSLFLFHNKTYFNGNKLNFVVIDSAKNPVRNFACPTGVTTDFTVVNEVIDNSGNIFVLATVKQSISSYSYQLKIFSADDSKGTEVQIASLDKLKFVDDLFLICDTKGAVYLTGRYLESKDQNFNAEGFFIQKINAETKKAEMWMNANFKTDAQDLKVLERTMRVDKIVCLADGSFGMVGECTFNSNFAYSTNEYLNDRVYEWMESVLIMKVSAAGKIISSKILERTQNIVDPAKRLFCGSAILMKGTKCFMVYNESLGSIEKRKGGDKPINYSAYRDKSAMVLAEIDLANCSYTEKYIADIKPCTDKLKPILIPGFGQLCNDDKTIAVKLDIGVKGSCRYVFVNIE